MTLKRILLLLGVIGGIAGWVVYKFYPFDGTYLVQTLPVPKGRKIEIRGVFDWEPNVTLTYRIRGLNDSGFFMTSSGGGTSQLGFQVISAEQGDLVGIIETNQPSAVVMMHDFRQNYTWMFIGTNPREIQTRGRAMLDRLQLENPKINWVLYKE